MDADTVVALGNTASKPVRFRANGGLEAAAMLASLAAHSVPGAERTDLAAGTH